MPLKPANIILTSKGVVKVIDFGLAKIISGDSQGMRLTQEGLALGTAMYMSPEQCLGTAVDGRSDLYSVGCVLYYCLTGRPPFNADDAIAVMMQHVHSEAPRLVAGETDERGICFS